MANLRWGKTKVLEIRLFQLACVMRCMWGKTRVSDCPSVTSDVSFSVDLYIDDSFLQLRHLFFHFSFIFYFFLFLTHIIVTSFCYKVKFYENRCNYSLININFIRLVTWPDVIGLWRKGYKGSKFICGIENVNKDHQQYCKQSRFSFMSLPSSCSFFFLFLVLFFFFFFLFFIFFFLFLKF